MRELVKADYLKLVEYASLNNDVPYAFLEWDEFYEYAGVVVPKERARGKNGQRPYTPAATKKFEADVKAWAKDKVRLRPYPVAMTIIVYDGTDDPNLVRFSRAGLVYKHKKDLDNIGKAISDALNGVAYKDDRQVVDINVRRRYSRVEGFWLRISRAGLSPHEYETFLRYYRLQHSLA